MNIFVRGALFPHWTRKRSGGVVASVSVWMPWSGRVDPNGLVRTGCRERVGWDALGRPSRPEWVGPCTVWIRSFWFETAVPCPLFPCASGRCLPCFVPLSPMPRPFLLAPRSLPPVAHGPLLSVHGPALSCSSARFLLLSSLCPRSSPCKRKPPKAWPSGVFGYCRSRITSQEPSG